MNRSNKTKLLLRDKYRVVHSDRLYRPIVYTRISILVVQVLQKATAIVCNISADYSTMMTHLLNVCSYNMRGLNSTKIPYVTDLLNRFSIIFLIEHWLTNK